MKNKGSASTILAVALPIIMVLILLGFDYIHASIVRENTQRKTDSAVLSIIERATPSGSVYLDESGFYMEYSEEIEDYESTPKRGCSITDDNVSYGINQLQKDMGDLDYEVVGESTMDQMYSGIAYLQVKGTVKSMSAAMIGIDWYIPYLVESYSSCSMSAIGE